MPVRIKIRVVGWQLSASVLLLILIECLKLSIFFDDDQAWIFNGLELIIVCGVIIFTRKRTSDALMISLVLSLMCASVLINLENIEVGGINAFILLASSMLLFLLYPKNLNIWMLAGGVQWLSIFFAITCLCFYLLGLQTESRVPSFILRGPYENENTIAMIAAVLLVWNFALKDWIKYRSIFYVLFFMIILTISRASGLVALVILAAYTGTENIRRMLIGVALIATVALVTAIEFPEIIEFISYRIIEGGDSGRFDMWNYALELLILNPKNALFGLGVNWLAFDSGERSVLSVHNSYINFYANYGGLAFIIFFSFLFRVLVMTHKKNKPIFVAMLALLLFSSFETSFASSFSAVWFTFIFLYVFASRLSIR